MNLSIDNWPYVWFGLWKEFGEGYENYPSIQNFIEVDINRNYEIERLKDYICNGYVVASTSRNNFPSPFTGEGKTGSISFRTDGKWIWLDDIYEYIVKYHLVIPNIWYKEIKNKDFTLPILSEDQLADIEWPINPI
jgi:hypothetical protein